MFVSLNMACSIDGKIATAQRGPMALGTEADRRKMSELRALNEIVLNGAATFKAYPFPLRVCYKDLILKRIKGGMEPQPISAISSSRLEIPRSTKWELEPNQARWVFCGRAASASTRARLEKSGVQVFQVKKERATAPDILKLLKKEKIERVLLEGGGEFNASFFEHDLIDKIYLTMTPWLIGGTDAPTIFEGKSLKKLRKFRLTGIDQQEQEVFLEYSR